MKNNRLRFVLSLFAIVFGGALEELLPQWAGVGFPILLAAVPIFALRPSVVLCVFYALASGGMEDSLSGLPLLTSASYFLSLAALVRWTRLPSVAMPFAYPLYQLWLSVWVFGVREGLLARLLVAVPVGLFTFAAVAVIIILLERKAGADEAG